MGPTVDPVRIGQRIHIVPTLEHGTWLDQTVINEGAAVPVNPKADSLPLSMRGIIPLTADLLHLLRDGDQVYGQRFRHRVKGMGKRRRRILSPRALSVRSGTSV